MVKSISLFNYQNFPRILLLGDLIINFNLNINALRFLRNGKVSQCIKLMGDIFKSISLKKILKLIVFKKNIVLKLTTSIQCMNLNRRRLVLTIHVLCFLFAGERWGLRGGSAYASHQKFCLRRKRKGHLLLGWNLQQVHFQSERQLLSTKHTNTGIIWIPDTMCFLCLLGLPRELNLNAKITKLT